MPSAGRRPSAPGRRCPPDGRRRPPGGGARYPLALVNGLRSLRAMERVLASGVVQLVSLCRPLIAEPDLPARLEAETSRRAACVSCGKCWPERPGEGIGCHNDKVRQKVMGRAVE